MALLCLVSRAAVILSFGLPSWVLVFLGCHDDFQI